MISVIMSVYNERIDHLKCAIDSILNQSYSDFEYLIIIDNPLRRDIVEQLLVYQKKDKRIRLICNDKNIGLTKCLIKGLKAAQGEYVARMDADDISSHNRLEIQKKYLDTHPRCSVVSGNIAFINENSKLIKLNHKYNNINENIKKGMRYFNFIAHPCVMYRKRDVYEIGGYREVPAVEDYDLWIRMILAGRKISVIDKVLLKYRIRDNSISNSNSYIQRVFTNLIREKYKKGQVIDISKNEIILDRISNKDKLSYTNALKLYNSSWDYIHKGKYLNGITGVFKAMMINKEIAKMLYETVMSYYYINR